MPKELQASIAWKREERKPQRDKTKKPPPCRLNRLEEQVPRKRRAPKNHPQPAQGHPALQGPVPEEPAQEQPPPEEPAPEQPVTVRPAEEQQAVQLGRNALVNTLARFKATCAKVAVFIAVVLTIVVLLSVQNPTPSSPPSPSLAPPLPLPPGLPFSLPLLPLPPPSSQPSQPLTGTGKAGPSASFHDGSQGLTPAMDERPNSTLQAEGTDVVLTDNRTGRPYQSSHRGFLFASWGLRIVGSALVIYVSYKFTISLCHLLKKIFTDAWTKFDQSLTECADFMTERLVCGVGYCTTGLFILVYKLAKLLVRAVLARFGALLVTSIRCVARGSASGVPRVSSGAVWGAVLGGGSTGGDDGDGNIFDVSSRTVAGGIGGSSGDGSSELSDDSSSSIGGDSADFNSTAGDDSTDFVDTGSSNSSGGNGAAASEVADGVSHQVVYRSGPSEPSSDNAAAACIPVAAGTGYRRSNTLQASPTFAGLIRNTLQGGRVRALKSVFEHGSGADAVSAAGSGANT